MGFKEIGDRVRNWGRWGADDERGALNLITPERIAAAARLVRRGAVFSLGIPLDHQHGIQVMPNAVGRINPVHLVSHVPGDIDFGAGIVTADDWLIMPTHAASHWDALAHAGYDDAFYNGVPTSVVKAQHGATRLGIEHAAAQGIVGRGVLLDLAGLHGVDALEGGHGVGPDELDAAEERQGVRVGPGDILLTRTGWWERFAADGDVAAFRAAEPGLTPACAEWLRERDVAVLAADNWAVEVMPPADPEDGRVPLHGLLIRDMGVMLGENLDLGALTADCRADGVWEFLFCSSPLKIRHGVGSPSNPLAIK